MKLKKDTTLYSTKDIGRMVYRSEGAVASIINRMNIVPDKSEILTGSAKKNYYCIDKVKLIAERYNSIDNSDTLKKHKSRVPDVIYVTRTNFIYESKSNFYSQKKIEKLMNKFAD